MRWRRGGTQIFFHGKSTSHKSYPVTCPRQKPTCNGTDPFLDPMALYIESQINDGAGQVITKMAQFIDKAKNFVAEKIANIKKPEAEVTDVDLKNVSREAVEYDAMVSVHNPYSHSIPICDISYNFKSAGRLITSGNVPDPGSLKGDDKTVLQVQMKVPYGVLVSLAKDVGADWDIDYEVEVRLTVDLPIFGNFTIPISKKGEIKLPSLSDLF